MAAAPDPRTERLLATLHEVQAVHATSGDEGRLADIVTARSAALAALDRTVRCERRGDTVVVLRGRPRVAVFAHLDTVGFTVAHGRVLYEIGGPDGAAGDTLRAVDDRRVPLRTVITGEARAGRHGTEATGLRHGGTALPVGTRLTYDNPLRVDGDELHGAGIDDRLGVAIALVLLEELPDVAVAFTADEEHGGKGALVAGHLLLDRHGIEQALILDVTWESPGVVLGKGPAVSLRDAHLPRQAYLDRVLAAAGRSGVRFQREVERQGGSDGGVLARSRLAIDWCFVGPPIRGNHGREETASLADALATLRLYTALVPALSQPG